MATRPFPSFLIYVDEDGDFRWRYQAAGNHKTLADSSEGYRNLKDCKAGIAALQLSWNSPIWQTKEVTDRER
jgi:uncharacterized protein YegP (UPF0339 family)